MALLAAPSVSFVRSWSWQQYSGPLTILAWQRLVSGYPVIFGTGSSNNINYPQALYIQNNNSYTWGQDVDGTLKTQSAHGVGNVGVWSGNVFRSDSNSARAFFSAGVRQTSASDTTVLTNPPVIFDTIAVGALPYSLTPNSTYLVDIAECAIWATGLPDALCAALSLGQINPLDVEPGALIGYWPLRSDLSDLGPQRVALAPTAAAIPQFSVDQHPKVVGPRLRPKLRLLGHLSPVAGTLTITGHAPGLDAALALPTSHGTIGMAGHALGINVGVVTQRWQRAGAQWRMTGTQWLVNGTPLSGSSLASSHATTSITGGQPQLTVGAPAGTNLAPGHATAAISGGSAQLSAAVVTLTGVTLTPNTATTSSGGTVIGTLAAQGSGGALGTVSYTLTNSAGGDFTLTGGNAIAFLPNNVPAGSYTITVQVSATSASNSPQSYTVPITVTAAATGVSALVATPSQTWIQLGQPIDFFTVTLSSISTAYAGLSVFNVAEGGRTAFSGSSLPALTPAAVGTYTVRIYDAASAGNLIGESAPITVWAAANGPASAALTIGALPTGTETEGTSFTMSGTVVTANNYVLVSYTSPYTTSNYAYLSAPVVNGTWTITAAQCAPWTSLYIDVLDPSTGLHVQSSKVTGAAASSAVVYFQPAQLAIPGLSTATLPATTLGRFILTDPGHLYPSPTWSGTGADASLTFNFDTYIASTATMVPGVHTITHTVTQAGQPTLTSEVDLYIPYSQPPTDISLTMQQTLTDQLPPYTTVATPFAYTGNGALPGAVTYTATDPTGSFRIIGVANDLITLKPLVAGTYNVTITATNGANPVYSKVFALTVVSNTAVASSNMTFTPAAMTNMVAPGAVVGTPVVTGLSGTVTWGIVTDSGERLAIDRTSGQLTTAKYLSAVVGAETCTVFATDGTRTCVAELTIPVTASGPTLTVGVGQTYATIQAAMQVVRTDPMGAYANATIEIHPGTYTDDVANEGYTSTYLRGHINFVGVLDANNNRPLITYSTFPAKVNNGKGAFLTDGFDLTLTNLEISRVRLDGGDSNEFIGVVRVGDSLDVTQHITAVKISNCVIHDCDMAVMGALAGVRVYLYDTELSFCGDGTGFSHNIYISSDPYSYPGVYVDAALLHFENCLTYACSRGHLFKSRCQKTVAINSSFINTNDGFCSSCMDVPDGGDLTVTGCTFYSGPNDDRGTCINYGAEYGGGHVARGNTVTIDNCSFQTSIENIYGYMSVQGVVNPFSGATFTHPPAWARMPSVTITNSSFAGFPGQIGGANDNVAICGTITVGENVTFPTTMAPYTIVHPGSTPWNGYMDTVVGPCMNPYSRYSYSQNWNPQTVVPTVWSAYTVSHTAAIGSVVATPTTAANADASSQPAGPFTYSVLTPTYIAPAPPASPFAVAADGTITVAAPLTQGQAVTMLIDASCATQAHSPQFFTIWVT